MKVQSLICVHLVVCHMLHVFSFEIDCLLSGQSVLCDQRVITFIVSHSIVFHSEK